MPRVVYSRIIDLRNISGIEEAERLHENGWKILSKGFDTIQFYKVFTNSGE
jgi:hypothetical protein